MKLTPPRPVSTLEHRSSSSTHRELTECACRSVSERNEDEPIHKVMLDGLAAVSRAFILLRCTEYIRKRSAGPSGGWFAACRRGAAPGQRACRIYWDRPGCAHRGPDCRAAGPADPRAEGCPNDSSGHPLRDSGGCQNVSPRFHPEWWGRVSGERQTCSGVR